MKIVSSQGKSYIFSIELYNDYEHFVNGNTKKQKKKENEIVSFSKLELFSQSNPNYILNDNENIFIYKRPCDNMICYGPNTIPWPIREETVWPMTVKDQHIPEPPKDVWFLIFKYLTIGDILSMGQVNLTLSDIARRDAVWTNLKLGKKF